MTRQHPIVIPNLRYADAPAAIEFLCRAFGFERGLVVNDERGGIRHAQLTIGNSMIMLASADGEPAASGGCIYVVIDAVDAHHRRAVEAGAEITRPPEDPDYGGRVYVCLDPEGNQWSFGSYDPWVS